jgi:hypothetical protein
MNNAPPPLFIAISVGPTGIPTLGKIAILLAVGTLIVAFASYLVNRRGVKHKINEDDFRIRNLRDSHDKLAELRKELRKVARQSPMTRRALENLQLRTICESIEELRGELNGAVADRLEIVADKCELLMANAHDEGNGQASVERMLQLDREQQRRAKQIATAIQVAQIEITEQLNGASAGPLRTLWNRLKARQRG